MAFSNFGYGIGNAFNSDAGFAGATIGGSLLGAVQTILLRQYADIPMAKKFMSNTSSSAPFLMKQLKGFGSPSAVIGISAGAIASIIGIFALVKGKMLKNKSAAGAVAGYGILALSTGLLSGAFPTTEWGAALAVDPNNPIGVPAVERVNNDAPAPAPVRIPENKFKAKILTA
ncbi:MAG: hypothetical protein OWT28_06445 [Firmicutes bacterium]|nr:hypothetical protein [Bacillota bacterium]